MPEIGERYLDTTQSPRVVEIVGTTTDGRWICRVVNVNFRKTTTKVSDKTLSRFYRKLVRLPVTCQPSNKGCRDAYDAECGCAVTKCWYGYAKSCHAKGIEAMDPIEWNAEGQPQLPTL